jgi:hypothetical protein
VISCRCTFLFYFIFYFYFFGSLHFLLACLHCGPADLQSLDPPLLLHSLDLVGFIGSLIVGCGRVLENVLFNAFQKNPFTPFPGGNK